MKVDVDFKDDRPIFDWNRTEDPPATKYDWGKNYEPPTKFTPAEIFKAAMIGLALFAGGLIFLILAFCVL